MELTGPLLSPSLKKNPLQKKILIFQEMELSSPLKKTFFILLMKLP